MRLDRTRAAPYWRVGLVLAATLAVDCLAPERPSAPLVSPAPSAQAELPEGLLQRAVDGDGPLVFPPAESAWSPRAALADWHGASARPTPSAAEPPDVIVAGKVLGYAPIAGRPGVVALEPGPDHLVSRQPELAVIWDQPVTLEQARRALSLHIAGTWPVAIDVQHAREDTFEGYPLDRRQVTRVRPRKRLPEGVSLAFRAEDARPDHGTREITLEVARPLAFERVECDAGTCEGPGQVRIEGSQVYLRFNHALADDPALGARGVTASPPIRGLRVSAESWSPRLVVSGEILPSTTYHLRVAGVRDVVGQRLARPVSLTFETAPLRAMATTPSGVLALDADLTGRFPLTTRNATEVRFRAWAVDLGDEAALEAAASAVRRRHRPAGAPEAEWTQAIAARRDRAVSTPVDLTPRLAPGRGWVLEAFVESAAFGAEEEASPENLALVVPGDARALAVHAHGGAGASWVHVARLSNGQPVPGARVEWGALSAVTDAFGIALVPDAPASGAVRVDAGDARALLSLQSDATDARDLYPALAAGDALSALDERAFLITDRGAYRPGQRVHVALGVRRATDAGLAPLGDVPLEVALLSASDELLALAQVTTSAGGAAEAQLDLERDVKLGRHRLITRHAGGSPLGEAPVLVAEYEAPRFLVDVERAEVQGRRFRASVRARYGFGAALGGAPFAWTLRRRLAPPPSGALGRAGLRFDREASWWEASAPPWSTTGSGRLDAEGRAAIDVVVPDGGERASELTLEANVSDASFRNVAASADVRLLPAARYAGVRLPTSWLPVGAPFRPELGVVDREGRALAGVPVEARLVRVDYHWASQLEEGGASTRWHASRREVARCTAQSADEPTSCELTPPSSGDYEVVAVVDGRLGGVTQAWAWRDGESLGRQPTRGREVEIVSERASYAPGDTARLRVRSPFPRATAILTLEQGIYLGHQVVSAQGGVATFDVPIGARHVPALNVSVTLLPLGDRAAASDFRVGALRIPVSDPAQILSVSLVPERTSYGPGEEVLASVLVEQGGAPRPGAQVIVTAVDEGVLRMTGWQAPDVARLLRPVAPLDFTLHDTRTGLSEWLGARQVAGDGPEEGNTAPSVRRDFRETTAWLPHEITGADGKAHVRFRLSDALAEVRLSAIAVDDAGHAGRSASALTVSKPWHLAPVVPRFAQVGDRFEIAALVHDQSGQGRTVEVSLGDEHRKVAVLAGGTARVAFPFTAGASGERKFAFALSVGGQVVDRVEKNLTITVPGADERPALFTSFKGRREVSLELPAELVADPEARLVVQTGPELWPELGARLQYLLDYPHGCVEQTTSSTLPLIAARKILPRIGASLSEEGIDARIRAGLERLATMRTASGGLGYWPGDEEPNVYGTAYAMRAVLAARREGIAAPKGLAEGMLAYLGERVSETQLEPEVRAAIAESLRDAGHLDPSRSDALYGSRDAQSEFGLASLALALAGPGHDERVDTLVDAVSAGLDAEGRLVTQPRSNDFYYYGSPLRSRAQAAIALVRLRPGAPVLGPLLRSLAGNVESYTTQGTAYALLALAEAVRRSPGDGAPPEVLLDGERLLPTRRLSGGVEIVLPVARLAGRKARLEVRSTSDAVQALGVRGLWRAPLTRARHLAAHSANGLDVYRVYTDVRGGPVDLSSVAPGSLVRVALAVRRPAGAPELRYVAITDRVPAGFEAVQPELATVAHVPDLDSRHPLHDLLTNDGGGASHAELRDDRVLLYFDHPNEDAVAASYVLRATTPGRFLAPPAAAELMYEAGSLGYGESHEIVVK